MEFVFKGTFESQINLCWILNSGNETLSIAKDSIDLINAKADFLSNICGQEVPLLFKETTDNPSLTIKEVYVKDGKTVVKFDKAYLTLCGDKSFLFKDSKKFSVSIAESVSDYIVV